LYGWQPEIVVFEESGRMIAGALLGVKPVPLIGGSRVLASGGLAMAASAPEESASRFLDALERHSAERNAVRLEVRWRRSHTVSGVVQEDGETARALLRRKEYFQVKRTGTFHVGLLGRDPETLLASLGKGARRDARRGIRSGLDIVEERAEASIAYFEKSHRRMATRKGISVLPAGFGPKFLGPAIAEGSAKLFSARYRGVACNMAVVSTVGAPLFAWGCLTEGGEGDGCPPTGQALQYGIMCSFLGHPAGYYDLGGSPGPEPEDGHPNYTVWRFKRSFNGEYIYHVGAWTKVRRPLADRAFRALQAMRQGRLGRALRAAEGE